MNIGVRVVADDPDALVSLYQWLEQDLRLGPGIRLELISATPRPEKLGSLFEAINVLVEDGVSLAGLAISYSTWRRTRRDEIGIIFERNGASVTASDESDESYERVAKLLSSEPGADDESSID